MSFNLLVQPHLFLLQDHFFGLQLFHFRPNVLKLFLKLNQVALVGDPILLHSNDFAFNLSNLLLNVVSLVLKWATVLVTVSVFRKLSPIFVQTIDFELFF